jgi:putative transposase
MKSGLGNLAASGVTELAATVTNRLKTIQYRPELLGGFLAQTGSALDPRRP